MLYEQVVLPTITYNMESTTNMTNKEMEDMEIIQGKMLRKIYKPSEHKRFPNVSPRLWFRYICFYVLGTFLYDSYLVNIRRLLERSDLINKGKNTLIHTFLRCV